MQTSLTSKGQATIPVKVRAFMHLQPGDKLEWEIHYDTDTVTLVAPQKPKKESWEKQLERIQKSLTESNPSDKESLVESLLKDRREDLKMEEKKLKINSKK